MKLADFAWIVALSTWASELVRKGVLPESYGWLMALFFVVALAGSRISEASLIGKVLHLGVPIAALLAFISLESLTLGEFEAVIVSVLPMLVVLFLLYLLITGAFRQSGND